MDWTSRLDAGLADDTFDRQFAEWQRFVAARTGGDLPPLAAYVPTQSIIAHANVTKLGFPSYAALHKWSAEHRDAFWDRVVRELAVPFRTRPTGVRDGKTWLPGARLNIVDACFQAPGARTAILLAREGEKEHTRVSYAQLETLVNRVARGYEKLGLQPGDGVSIYMPMTVECVAAYLGIIRAGGVVVSIADSFAPPEVATRNRLGGAKAILTTAAFQRGGKTIDLYAKVKEAKSPVAIVIGDAPLREGDLAWDAFLGEAGPFEGPAFEPSTTTNILFSSGTTGDPKAIPWSHLTPLKAAMDGRYHQDIHSDDVVAWPTSIGWMMGPWLIFATLMNQATMALFEGAPNSPEFPKFVKDAQLSVLGVVPALVRAWRTSGTVGSSFESVRVFSSTGEASNVEDYLWLMSTARYRAPVIEYCGGTEIGGGHLTGTVVQPQSPATFSTPALGVDFVILDERGNDVRVGEMGELFIIPPSIGLSQRLLNRDHDKEYFEGTPRPGLRRHGDEVQRLVGGYYSAHGRADDTMNLGGIKVSSLELERVMDRHPDVYQSAAVSVIPASGGADQLVVFVVPKGSPDVKSLQKGLQEAVKQELNPLYRIHDVVLVDALPRTASNKIMRRELRKSYKPQSQ